MSFMWLQPALISIGLLATPAALPQKEDAPQPGVPATGELLVASPDIGDPRFRHAVILLVRHDAQGAFGIIINRPVGDSPLADLLGATGQDKRGVTGTVRVFAGGPVQPQLGFVVHSTDYHRPGTIAIDSHVSMTSSRDILNDIAHRHGPARALIAFGYAGWTAGQLENEKAHGAWFTEPEDPSLVFDEDRDKVWDDALARRAIPL
jgi:putative transcriptional regulator